jgi:Tol biopolymer transport system component
MSTVRLMACALVALAVTACDSAERPRSVGAAAQTPLPVPVTGLGDLAYGHDGRLLAVVEDPVCSRVVVSEVRGDRVVPVMRLRGCTSGAALSRNGRLVAQFIDGRRGSRIVVRSLVSDKRRVEVAVSPAVLDVPHAFWSPDGRRLLTEVEGRTGESVFDARSGRRLRRIRGGDGYLGRQPFSPDGRQVVTSDARGALVTTIASGRRRLVNVPGGLDRPSWSPVGTSIAGGAGKGVAWVDVTTGKRGEATVGALEVAWSPDGRRIAAYGSADDGWAVSVIDVATGVVTVIHRFAEGAERGELAWSPDGTKLAFRIPEPF